jgi:AraC-like DNA-binding protein
MSQAQFNYSKTQHHKQPLLQDSEFANTNGKKNSKVLYMFSPVQKQKRQNLVVKNMVSLRCIIWVKNVLTNLNIKNAIVELGTIEFFDAITKEQRQLLSENLKQVGLELIDDKKEILVEKIKAIIINLVHFSEVLPEINYSYFISNKLQYDYTYLSNVFSEIKGTTIQEYIIRHRIERVKQLLTYRELNLTEISYKLNYSSVAHLSNQFKKVTGLSPSCFKQLNQIQHINLEDL